MSFLTYDWLIEAAFEWLFQTIIMLLSTLPVIYLARKWWMYRPNAQVTYIYTYFCKGKLVLSTQLSDIASDFLEPEAIKILERAFGRTDSGRMVRLVSLVEKQATLAHLANHFWAARSSDGHIATDLGLPVAKKRVIICLISTPKILGRAAMGRKFRVLVVGVDTLSNLPQIDGVEKGNPKIEEWLGVLHSVKKAVKEEQSQQEWPFLSFEEGDWIIRT